MRKGSCLGPSTSKSIRLGYTEVSSYRELFRGTRFRNSFDPSLRHTLAMTTRCNCARQKAPKLGSFCRTIGMLNRFDSSAFDMRKWLCTNDLRNVKHVLSTWSRFDGTSRQISQILPAW